MKTFTSHQTALEYWRLHFPLDSELGSTVSASLAEECASRKPDVLDAVQETFRIPGKPVDVLVFDSDVRRPSDQVTCHTWRTSIPDGAFYRVGSMYVSSPEFVFLQMAPSLTMPQLIALGCELCGTYTLLPAAIRHPSALDDQPPRIAPLTNTGKLANFIAQADKARGLVKARRALKYILDNSRSPMETMTYLLLSLPPRLGGYGLPQPVLNQTIELDAEARTIAQAGHAEGDLCWRDCKLDIEYNGEVHADPIRMKRDAGRRAGIEHMGWRVITITGPQVFDIAAFEVIATEAAGRMRKRLRAETLGMTDARCALHSDLESWMFAV